MRLSQSEGIAVRFGCIMNTNELNEEKWEFWVCFCD